MKSILILGLLTGSTLAVGLAPVPATSPGPSPASSYAGGVEIGQEAPEIEFVEWRNFPEGASSLADLRGRVVLLDFWRTW
jgi:hypothetical protein